MEFDLTLPTSYEMALTMIDELVSRGWTYKSAAFAAAAQYGADYEELMAGR